MEINLTNDAKTLLCIAYKQYLESRNDSKTREQARNMHSLEFLTKNLDDWMLEDAIDVCHELSRTGLFKCDYADNTVYRVFISDLGISYMESQPKITEFISRCKSTIEVIANIATIASLFIH